MIGGEVSEAPVTGAEALFSLTSDVSVTAGNTARVTFVRCLGMFATTLEWFAPQAGIEESFSATPLTRAGKVPMW
jgi:hypothetical protein